MAISEVGAATGATSNPTGEVPSNTQGTGGKVDGQTKISSLSALKEKSPKLYNMMMQGIAMNIVNEMRHHQEQLKEIMRKARTP